MTIRITLITFGLLTALGLLSQTPTQAAEVTILVNQGALSGVRDLAAGFETASGHKVVIDFVGIPQQNEKIATDAPGDVVVNFLPTFEDLAKNGKVVAGTVVEFARAGNGVAVKAGAPKPDISTPEAFKQAMLNAKSIGHSNAGTGPYNTRMFQKLGIYDQIKDKIKIVQGKPVAVAVADGEVEIGIQQTNVIQPVAGTQYLGPLPPELMEYGRFGIAVRNVSKNQDVAKALIAFMVSPEAAALLRKSAMEPPAR
jgi:molybdate transport system substrate-binding protein